MAGTTVGKILRSTQSFCSQLCEKQTLDFGIAYYSERFRLLPEANQFREVVIEDAAHITTAYDQAERWFNDRHLFCFGWSPAAGDATAELTRSLEQHGFRAEQRPVLTLTQWADIDADPDVRVLPARALRAAYRRTFVEAEQPAIAAGRELFADAYAERLNDPQYDAFVALVDKKPAGRCTLYQVGDFARIMDFAVLPPYADRRVAQSLLAQVLTMARRLSMRSVCVEIGPAHEAWRSAFENVGFVADGAVAEFIRDAPPGFGSDR